jgi:hypothetical protein
MLRAALRGPCLYCEEEMLEWKGRERRLVGAM